MKIVVYVTICMLKNLKVKKMQTSNGGIAVCVYIWVKGSVSHYARFNTDGRADTAQ